ERVEMRAGMIVHDSKTGRPLALLRIEFPRLGNTIVPITLLNDLWTETSWSDNAGHIAMHFLTQRIHFPLLDQAGRFDNHVRGDDVDHAAFVFLTPAPPVPTCTPLAFDSPGGRFVGEFVVERIRRGCWLGTG